MEKVDILTPPTFEKSGITKPLNKELGIDSKPNYLADLHALRNLVYVKRL